MHLLKLFRHTPQELTAPHIPVGSSVASALSLLESCADQVLPLDGNERGYSATSTNWELIIYAAADEVDAVAARLERKYERPIETIFSKRPGSFELLAAGSKCGGKAIERASQEDAIL